jgi:hypothetical protein
MTYTYGMAKAYQEQLVRESETGQAGERLGPRFPGALRELIRNSLGSFAPLHLQRKPSGDAKTAV